MLYLPSEMICGCLCKKKYICTYMQILPSINIFTWFVPHTLFHEKKIESGERRMSFDTVVLTILTIIEK